MKPLCFFLLTVFCLGIYSCKKKDVSSDPVITFIKPSVNQIVVVPDTLIIKASIDDESIINSINVRLVDENYQFVGPVKTYTPNQNHFEFELNYPITNTTFTSGLYYVYIQVFNSAGMKNKYQPIHLVGLPRKLKSLLLISRDNYHSIKLLNVDSLFNTNLIHTFDCDFGHSLLLNDSRTLWIAGRTSGKLYSFDVDSLRELWCLSGQGSLELPYFQGLSSTSDILLASSSDGLLRGYKRLGQNSYYSDFGFVQYPAATLVHQSYLVVNVLSKSNSDSYVRTLYYPSGAMKQQTQVSFKVVSFYTLTDDQILFIANTNGRGALGRYFLSSNNTSIDKEISSVIVATARISDDKYLIATNSALYIYNPTSNEMSEFASQLKVVSFCFDELSGTIAVIEPLSVKFYNISQPQLLHEIHSSDSLFQGMYLYNR